MKVDFDKIYSSLSATVSFLRSPASGGGVGGGVFEKELRGGG